MVVSGRIACGEGSEVNGGVAVRGRMSWEMTVRWMGCGC